MTVIYCPKCGAEIYADTSGVATARWREHVATVHAGVRA